jgi:8-oxo-dGTP pyrophosphatase MutT (NUDIX family)
MYTVAVTAIIKRADGRMLITKRSSSKKKWPDKWTVPGGQVEDKDFLGTPTAINNQWYNTLENAVRRECLEETGIEVEGIKFLCDIAVPGCIIISFTATAKTDQVTLQQDECSDYAWVTAEEAEGYDLIDGILNELRDASSQEPR